MTTFDDLVSDVKGTIMEKIAHNKSGLKDLAILVLLSKGNITQNFSDTFSTRDIVKLFVTSIQNDPNIRIDGLHIDVTFSNDADYSCTLEHEMMEKKKSWTLHYEKKGTSQNDYDYDNIYSVPFQNEDAWNKKKEEFMKYKQQLVKQYPNFTNFIYDIDNGFDPTKQKYVPNERAPDNNFITNLTNKEFAGELSNNALAVSFLRNHGNGTMNGKTDIDVKRTLDIVKQTTYKVVTFDEVQYLSYRNPVFKYDIRTQMYIAAANILLDAVNAQKIKQASHDGGAINKIRILGRDRVVTKVGRKMMITYNKHLMSVAEAKKLEKQKKRGMH